MAVEPDGASGALERRRGERRAAPISLGEIGDTPMWAVALDGEEFAPMFGDPCDVIVALRLTRASHREYGVRVVAVPRLSSPN